MYILSNGKGNSMSNSNFYLHHPSKVIKKSSKRSESKLKDLNRN